MAEFQEASNARRFLPNRSEVIAGGSAAVATLVTAVAGVVREVPGESPAIPSLVGAAGVVFSVGVNAAIGVYQGLRDRKADKAHAAQISNRDPAEPIESLGWSKASSDRRHLRGAVGGVLVGGADAAASLDGPLDGFNVGEMSLFPYTVMTFGTAVRYKARAMVAGLGNRQIVRVDQ